jgi:glycosyltransferase involved in cell wall biosynthesis
MVVPKYPPPILGGLEKQAMELSQALVRRGYRVSVLSTRFHPTHPSESRQDGVDVYRIAWVGNKLLRFLASTFAQAALFLRLRGKIDLVHVHNLTMFATPTLFLAKLSAVPVVSKLSNIGSKGIPGIRKRPFLGRIRLAVLLSSRAIVAMTPENFQELDEIAYPPHRILRIPNGISVSPASSRHERSHGAKLRAVFVGRLTPQKGLPDLLRAWAALSEKARSGAILSIIGEGEQTLSLKELSTELGIRESVEFPGYSDDVRSALDKADLFVLPSLLEGNSNAILEAMSAGLPIVATAVGGAKYQVGELGATFLVGPGDIPAMTEKIGKLLEDEKLREELGAAMRERVELMFNIDVIARQYDQAYRGIIGEKRKSRDGVLSRVSQDRDFAL